MQDEITYKLLKLIQKSPQLSQREIAERLGISLGKTNKSIKLLIDKGLITIQEHVNRRARVPFIYSLTASGINELPRIAAWSLREKENQISQLQREIEDLKEDLSTTNREWGSHRD